MRFRVKFLQQVRKDLQWPVWIHPTAVVTDPFLLGAGTVVDPLSVIGWRAKTGMFCKFGPATKIGHNSSFGHNVVVTAGTAIGGSTVIGSNVYMGHGCLLRDKITIGDDVFLSIGSVVIKDIGHPGEYYHHKRKITVQT